MRGAGIEIAEAVVADGVRHRVKAVGDKGSARNAWYILHMDERPAGMFGHYRLLGGQKGIGWKFQGAAEPLTREQRREWARSMAAKRAEREKAEAAGYEAAAQVALGIWAAAEPATVHPYLTGKQVKPHLCRLDADRRRLLIPALIDGQVWSLQYVAIDGEKRFLPGGKMSGAYCPVGPKPTDGDTIAIAEGFATAASVHEATGLTVFAAFSAGNLPAVAAMVRKRWP